MDLPGDRQVFHAPWSQKRFGLIIIVVVPMTVMAPVPVPVRIIVVIILAIVMRIIASVIHCVGRVSEFRVSGEVAGDEDFVDVHNSDLGFRFDVVLRLISYQLGRVRYATCRIFFQAKYSLIFGGTR